MYFDAMSVIQSFLEHREAYRVAFDTEEFVSWVQQLEGANQRITLLEANEILKKLSDTNDQIELAFYYTPENNLGWFYSK
ncbi:MULTISPECIES: hypothetical protein [Vibrio]|uniref:Uncharacterized protein n=1 Tax=Vibrio neptunius TaxID=170651 RepID=A0ABS2ZXI4_9VIBR|nr:MULTISPECIES: hypothetical protein [Vibrio]KJY87261.1 hypothetical protein TW84_17320 [Vibrio neptunius]MBN3492346.1 hypothetical protein [Vibrio neptunius]MBN3514839.1 hypothetical protein [Vibrio neptunius]MBN3549726.1 hypothetical protein [Vibrio neptunius]MBN3576971.1 hypothetical protein [Vibrio neptunius]